MSKLKNLCASVIAILAVGSCGNPMDGQAPVGEEDTGPDFQTSQGAVSAGYFNTYTDVVASLRRERLRRDPGVHHGLDVRLHRQNHER